VGRVTRKGVLRMIEYPTKILLATDGTEYSAMAAEAAVALSNKTGAELHVVNVGQAHHSGSGVTVEAGGLPGDSYENIVDRARKLLERQVQQIQGSGGTIAETHLRVGSPPYEVVGLSDEIGADLIVVGSGRPRAMRRAVSETMRRPAIGAAADYIVRSAHCPVLVVRSHGVLPSDVPRPDAGVAVSEGEPEAIGDRREQDQL
jgi:nucleotide-binding universal stress UspA family protein